METKNYAPNSIFNMDETGLSTVPNKLPQVLAQKGKKLVGKVTSADRGQLVTAVCCMSATGTYIPPALIFPRKRMKEELFMNAPSGSLKMISESGFINSELFCQWLIHFKNYSKPSANNPILLVLDNHSSHRDLQAIKYCRENHIDLLSLPPHASHKTQPLDIGFFGPLKAAYSKECDNWMINNPGKVITQMQVAGLFNAAYGYVANIQKAPNSFEASGIYPFNPEQFQDEDFAPSLVTDVPMHSVIENIQETVGDEPSREEIDNPSSPLPLHVTPPPALQDISNLDIVCEDGIVIASTSAGPNLSASDLFLLPKVQKIQNRKKCKSQRSEILSSTPFKDELEALAQEKEEREENKRAKAVKKNLNSLSVPAKKKQRKINNKSADEDVSCPRCNDLYSKSVEDWIM